MEVEYKILGGNKPTNGGSHFDDLERQVRDVISNGGETIGGLTIDHLGKPFQAVYQRISYNNSFGGARKVTRKVIRKKRKSRV